MDLPEAPEISWFKSSRSTGSGAACVEVAHIPPVWFKSNHSQGSGASCVEVAFAPSAWFKSGHSTGEGANCVEVARVHRAVGVRDSKRGNGPALCVPRPAFAALVSAARTGRLG